MITYNIEIDPHKTRSSYSDIEFTTGDTRGYCLSFSFRGVNASGDIVVKAKRNDGVVVTAYGQGMSITLPNNIYSVPGELMLEVALSGENGEYVTTHVLITHVREGFGEEGIASDDRYPILTAVISEVNGYKSLFEECLDENGNIDGDMIASGSVSKEKLTSELKTELEDKADSDSVYTKAEANTLLDGKESIDNKVNVIAMFSPSNTHYPSEKAVKDYVDQSVTLGVIEPYRLESYEAASDALSTHNASTEAHSAAFAEKADKKQIQYRLIRSITLTEDATTVDITTDNNGNSFNCSKIIMRVHTPIGVAYATTKAFKICTCNNTGQLGTLLVNGGVNTKTNSAQGQVIVYRGEVLENNFNFSARQATLGASLSALAYNLGTQQGNFLPVVADVDSIKGLQFCTSDTTGTPIKAGTEISLWGIDA